jgi:predicted DNA repair protein MutK
MPGPHQCVCQNPRLPTSSESAMASSFFALFDDIATLLDDVSVMTKVATKKTAGVLGDDLALNAQQVSGVNADRELPVVWAVAKGSAVNKVILIPAALALAAFERWLHGQGIDIPIVTALMMIGGAYLCYEGVEKLAHKFLHKEEEAQHHAELVQAVQDEQVDMLQFEKQKIKGAIRTDFILSAEIIVITLGTVATQPFSRQLAVLVAIGLIMTVGVYGLVAGIVKLDDLGVRLTREGAGAASRAIGRGILRTAPWLMKFLSIAGTAAMFLVGGGILVHGIPALHHFIEPYANGSLGWLWSNLFNAAVGIVAGIVVLAAVKAAGKLRGPRKQASAA